MDVKSAEVKQWLEEIFSGSANIPDFEKTSPSINLLYQLMKESKRADHQARVLTEDYKIRAHEYAAKGEQKAAALKCVGLGIGDLKEDAQTALGELSHAAVIVNATVPSENSIMLGSIQLEAQHDEEKRPRVFCLPKEQSERQKWLDVIPPRENFVVDLDKFFICEIHWGADPPLIKLYGGSMRPEILPSIFNVPASCLPFPKPAPRPAKVEDQQQVFSSEG
ncbi:hypothetical protein FHG87_016964 [Trinorchestia longiramus]|nr:hypothetical protein FHG87_016964 [Trinorchestia longiramus]